MYGSWTEIAVLLRSFLGFIWDLSDVFTTRAQMQSFRLTLIIENKQIHSE